METVFHPPRKRLRSLQLRLHQEVLLPLIRIRRHLVLFVILVFLVALRGIIVCAYCDELDQPTWAEFVRVVSRSQTFAFLCPFEIRGDGCPDEDAQPYVILKERLVILCADYLGGENVVDCSINCPHSHFQVPTNHSLRLVKVTMRESKSSAVLVDAGGEFVCSNCKFEDNINQDGQGGAVRAAERSEIQLQDNSVFKRNKAVEGGAVYALGHAEFDMVQMKENQAVRGGAIHLGSNGSLEISRSQFTFNQAEDIAPVVYAASTNTTQRDNISCGNFALFDTCNGISDGGSRCDPFREICPAPTPSPIFEDLTTSPQPEFTATEVHGLSSMKPTLFPSFSSSIQASESAEPIESPFPSSFPVSSSPPTFEVTDAPTNITLIEIPQDLFPLPWLVYSPIQTTVPSKSTDAPTNSTGITIPDDLFPIGGLILSPPLKSSMSAAFPTLPSSIASSNLTTIPTSVPEVREQPEALRLTNITTD